jgi:flagellar hook assembly protein FlgD
MAGHVVATIVDRQFEAGRYSVPWNGESVNGTGLSSGVYIYRLEAGHFAATRKMVLLR